MNKVVSFSKLHALPQLYCPVESVEICEAGHCLYLHR